MTSKTLAVKALMEEYNPKRVFTSAVNWHSSRANARGYGPGHPKGTKINHLAPSWRSWSWRKKVCPRRTYEHDEDEGNQKSGHFAKSRQFPRPGRPRGLRGWHRSRRSR